MYFYGMNSLNYYSKAFKSSRWATPVAQGDTLCCTLIKHQSNPLCKRGEKMLMMMFVDVVTLHLFHASAGRGAVWDILYSVEIVSGSGQHEESLFTVPVHQSLQRESAGAQPQPQTQPAGRISDQWHFGKVFLENHKCSLKFLKVQTSWRWCCTKKGIHASFVCLFWQLSML